MLVQTRHAHMQKCSFMKLSPILFCITLLTYSIPSLSQSAPLVAELFTSQGCSSCPRADRLLATLSKRDKLLVMSCHVTYWNYLGWRDTLSLSECDRRQSQYRQHLKSTTNYTPQLVVNGHAHTVGSQRNKVEALLENAQQNNPVQGLTVTLEQGKLFLDTARLAPSTATPSTAPRFIELFYLAENHKQYIEAGENSGRDILYTRPVLKIETLHFEADHAKGGFRTAIQAPQQADTLVVLIKDTQWQLIAAGEQALR